MSDLAITVFGGVIVAIIVAIFGIGNTTHVVIHGSGRVLRSGKWIMTLSVITFFVGLSWAQSENSLNGNRMILSEGGSVLAMYSVLFFFIGKFIAWMQR